MRPRGRSWGTAFGFCFTQRYGRSRDSDQRPPVTSTGELQRVPTRSPIRVSPPSPPCIPRIDDPVSAVARGAMSSPWSICITGSRSGPRRRWWPPSALMQAPVIHELSGPARNRTRPAMSSVVPGATERHLCEVVVDDRRNRHDRLGCLRRHETWPHRIGPDADGAEFVGDLLDEHLEAGLRHRVRRHVAVRRDAGDRRDRDDRPTARLDEIRRRMRASSGTPRSGSCRSRRSSRRASCDGTGRPTRSRR